MDKAQTKERLEKDEDYACTQAEQGHDLLDESKEEPVEKDSVYSAPVKMATSALGAHPPAGNVADKHYKIRDLQKSYGNLATLRLSQHSLGIQTNLAISRHKDKYEQEADQVSGHVIKGREVRPVLTHIQQRIQRFSEEDNASNSPPSDESAQTETGGSAASASLVPLLLVDDSEIEPRPEQMRKSEFLSQLRTSVCSTAETALSGTIWSAVGCPWISHWFDYYGNRDSVSIERAIRRYAPGAAAVTTAREYIPLICRRVQQAISTWSMTGELVGIPDGLPEDIPEESTNEEIYDTSQQEEYMSLKSKDCQSITDADPVTIQAKLDRGQPLDIRLATQMGAAFGHDFSNVRVHTDSNASQLTDELHSRAFTIHQDIAFSQGEYRPGTIIGDALIAHELAHVIQQRDGSAEGPMLKDDSSNNIFETNANKAALGAILSLWGLSTPPLLKSRDILKTGLRLQRCRCEPTVEFNNVEDVGIGCEKEVQAIVTEWDEDNCEDENIDLTIENQSNERGTASVRPAQISGNDTHIILIRGESPTRMSIENNLQIVGNVDGDEIPERSRGFNIVQPHLCFENFNNNLIYAETDIPYSVGVEDWQECMGPIILSIENSGNNSGEALINGATTHSFYAQENATWDERIHLRGITASRCGRMRELVIVAHLDYMDTEIGRSDTFSVQGVRWFENQFVLTHYIFIREDDPTFAGDEYINANGLDEPHRRGFLFGRRGVIMQGTGFAENGRYITIDWTHGGPNGVNTHFTYGVGGRGGVPRAWETVASDPAVIALGTDIVIERYLNRGQFEVNDTGGGINGNHLDIFIGAVTLEEANRYGRVRSRVGIIEPCQNVPEEVE